MKWRPARGEWSAHEIVCPCADSETNGHARIGDLLAAPRPLTVAARESVFAWAG